MFEVLGFILSVIAGLLILVFLVVVHELGHGIIARRNGVVVEEFGVGFPPKAWGKKIKNSWLGKDVLFSLNWLPIGGFVKLKGEYDSASKKGDYGAASFWAKTKIILAGVAVNWLTAALIFTVLALVGLPRIIPNQFRIDSDTQVSKSPVLIRDVVKGLPAEKGGLKKGDKIVEANISGVSCGNSVNAGCGSKPSSFTEIDEIVAATKENPGKRFLIIYQRDGKEQATVLTNRSAEQAVDGKGYMGISMSQDSPTTYQSTWSAPIVGVGITSQLSVEIIKGLGDLLAKVGTGIIGKVTGDDVASRKLSEAGDSVAGPIGIVGKILPGAVNAGIIPVLLITAILSVTLAVMNILPIPALDGGRWYLMAIFRVLKKPLTQELEERINGAGMIILLGLIILITITDVGKLL